MALAVCLLLDDRADRAIRELWSRLEDAEIPTLLTHTHGRHVPHVSYAVYRTYDVEAVLGAVAALPAAQPIELHFDAVGLFRRRRGALMASASDELLSRQRLVLAAGASTGADLHRSYRAGLWFPHCSLSTGVHRNHLATMATAAFDVLPLDATAERAALIDSGTGERWPLPRLV